MFSITSGPLCGFPSPLMCAPIAIAPDGVFKNMLQTWHLFEVGVFDWFTFLHQSPPHL